MSMNSTIQLNNESFLSHNMRSLTRSVPIIPFHFCLGGVMKLGEKMRESREKDLYANYDLSLLSVFQITKFVDNEMIEIEFNIAFTQLELIYKSLFNPHNISH